ncbi:tuzin-like protein [Leishmania donovani]|uniref:Tuzin-like protein n=1 Tax=Leishmania donovani TaxID=5661 RepID=E9BQR7_LEIDO|nr:tuzin-like protein [Leishmania donovani]CBZ37596.1 tuzin-like protein [Leishmania donovani]
MVVYLWAVAKTSRASPFHPHRLCVVRGGGTAGVAQRPQEAVRGQRGRGREAAFVTRQPHAPHRQRAAAGATPSRHWLVDVPRAADEQLPAPLHVAAGTAARATRATWRSSRSSYLAAAGGGADLTAGKGGSRAVCVCVGARAGRHWREGAVGARPARGDWQAALRAGEGHEALLRPGQAQGHHELCSRHACGALRPHDEPTRPRAAAERGGGHAFRPAIQNLPKAARWPQGEGALATAGGDLVRRTDEQASAYTQHAIDAASLNRFFDGMGARSSDVDELLAAVHHGRVSAARCTNARLLEAVRCSLAKGVRLFRSTPFRPALVGQSRTYGVAA